MQRNDLTGMRILVVEDNALVADMIADILVMAGAEVVGPTGWVATALELAGDGRLHGALLDVNLHGDPSFPVAAVLRQRGIPFIFLTGYGEPDALPPVFRGVPRLIKPFREDDLAMLISVQFRAEV